MPIVTIQDWIAVAANVATAIGVPIAISAGLVALGQFRYQRKFDATQIFIGRFSEYLDYREDFRSFLSSSGDFGSDDVVDRLIRGSQRVLFFAKIVLAYASASKDPTAYEFTLAMNDLTMTGIYLERAYAQVRTKGPRFQLNEYLPKLAEIVEDPQLRTQILELVRKYERFLDLDPTEGEIAGFLWEIGSIEEAMGFSYSTQLVSKYGADPSIASMRVAVARVMERAHYLQYLIMDLNKMVISLAQLQGPILKKAMQMMRKHAAPQSSSGDILNLD